MMPPRGKRSVLPRGAPGRRVERACAAASAHEGPAGLPARARARSCGSWLRISVFAARGKHESRAPASWAEPLLLVGEDALAFEAAPRVGLALSLGAGAAFVDAFAAVHVRAP